MKADRDWLRRAERGPGVAGGPDRTRTAYFYNGGFHPYGASWGVLVGGTCGEPSPSPSCFAVPTPDAGGVIPSFVPPTPSGSAEAALPCPPASPSASPSSSRAVRGAAADRGAATDRGADADPEPPPTEEPTQRPR